MSWTGGMALISDHATAAMRLYTCPGGFPWVLFPGPRRQAVSREIVLCETL